jgi:hypothetical protein
MTVPKRLVRVTSSREDASKQIMMCARGRVASRQRVRLSNAGVGVNDISNAAMCVPASKGDEISLKVAYRDCTRNGSLNLKY